MGCGNDAAYRRDHQAAPPSSSCKPIKDMQTRAADRNSGTPRKTALQRACQPEDQAGDDDRANQMRNDSESLMAKGGAQNQLQQASAAVAMASA